MKYFSSNELICCSSISGCLDMCILKFNTWPLRNFKKWRQNRHFWFSKIVFQLVMSPESLDQNSSNSIGIIIESSKCCENKNGKTKEMDN